MRMLLRWQRHSQERMTQQRQLLQQKKQLLWRG